eukprot:CAMPEP_0168745602 /NCGR_PEP_ID=MMETSP0724-20121128/14704_1 /TAXON_ID=265536 /ORGANISM="Amphiprora sp., Strain CCMP467" /LENGTH=354 /DNA_ID=CAMNT_0008793323 /DNA_START=505 /DNA_END=1566 /DNA_ORIENTATION=-
MPTPQLYPTVSSSDEESSSSLSYQNDANKDAALLGLWSLPTQRLKSRSSSEELTRTSMTGQKNGFNDSSLVREQQMILDQIQRDHERAKKKKKEEELHALNADDPPLTHLVSSLSSPPRLLGEVETRDESLTPAGTGCPWDADDADKIPEPSPSSSIPPLMVTTAATGEGEVHHIFGDSQVQEESELQFLEEQRRIWEQIQKNNVQTTATRAAQKDSSQRLMDPPTQSIRLSNFDGPIHDGSRQQSDGQSCTLPSSMLSSPMIDREDENRMERVHPAPSSTVHRATNDDCQNRRATTDHGGDDGVVRQFTNGQKIKLLGTERAELAVADGTAVLFLCPSCQRTFRISESSRNVY